MTGLARVLLVERDDGDAFLVRRSIERGGLEVALQRVGSPDELEAALDADDCDAVLADYVAPGFGAREVLTVLRSRGLDIPLVVVSSLIGEEVAVKMMREGARDYIPKTQLARLAPALERELAEASARRVLRAAERLARERDRQFRELVENSPDLIFRLDPSERVVLASRAAEGLAGIPVGEMEGLGLVEAGFPTALADRLERHARRVRTTEERSYLEFHTPTLQGERWFQARVTAEHDDEDRHPFVLVTATDITRRKEVEEELTHRALHDPLTGLPNRSLLLDRLSHAMARLEREKGLVAVLFVDLDRFKAVNDNYGHEAGDEVLLQVARRLAETLRPSDTIARLGGDEFVVLIEDLEDEAGVLALAERVLASLAPPVELGVAEVRSSASIGIACARHPDDPETLLRGADIAMYRAKQRGRNRCEFFDETLREHAQLRRETETALMRAHDNGELRLFWQPQVSLADRRVVGMEALLRWQHPRRGLLDPAGFLEVAEETGLIVPLGRWVTAEACRQVAAWKHQGITTPVTWINLSPREIAHDGLVSVVQQTLDEHGLAGPDLGVEITETLLIDDHDTVAGPLAALRDLGVHLAVDDFGTGYSSLEYLQRFPVDVLKVDRGFVVGVGSVPTDSAIVGGVVGIARALGLTVVAEGVETVLQAEALAGLGCALAQGYYFGRPVPAGEFVNHLVGDTRRTARPA